ncbi:MAG: hypothetical protein ACOX5J_11825 [Candidatus Hydrogenedentales bacterium]
MPGAVEAFGGHRRRLFKNVFQDGYGEFTGYFTRHMPAQTVRDTQQRSLTEKLQSRRVITEHAIKIFILTFTAANVCLRRNIDSHKTRSLIKRNVPDFAPFAQAESWAAQSVPRYALPPRA